MIGTWLAWLFTVGMLGLGVAACLAPTPTSALYGVARSDPAGWAWVRAAGLRDLGLCLILGWALVQGAHDAAAVAAIATGLVACADLANVVVTRGIRPILPLMVHASGIGMGLVSGLLLLARI